MGSGYEYLLDLSPGERPDQAAEYNGALVRTEQPGWIWWARFSSNDKKVKMVFGRDNIFGEAATKEEALRDGMKALDDLKALHRVE